MKPKDNVQVIRAGDVKPGEAPMVYLTRYGVAVNDENGATIHAHDGSTMLHYVDGGMEVRNPNIRRIDFDDVLSIVKYRTVCTADTTLHIIEFEGGGVFAYLRDARGKVIEMSWRGGVHTRADWDGHWRVFGARPDGDAGSPPA